MVIKVAERYIYLKRLIVKLIENIISEYTDISSLKQCLIIVTENQRFSFYLLKKKIKTGSKIFILKFFLMRKNIINYVTNLFYYFFLLI